MHTHPMEIPHWAIGNQRIVVRSTSELKYKFRTPEANSTPAAGLIVGRCYAEPQHGASILFVYTLSRPRD